MDLEGNFRVGRLGIGKGGEERGGEGNEIGKGQLHFRTV